MTVQRDPVVGTALDHLPIPEHHEGFWEDFFSGLHRLDTVHPPGDADRVPPADAPSGAGRDRLAPVVHLDEIHPSSPDRPRVNWRVLAGIAASIVVFALAIGIGHLQSRSPSAPVVADEPPTAGDGGGGGSAPSTTDVHPVDAADLVAAQQQVVGFIDALGRGDTAAAAGFVGPISEQNAEATAGLDSMLTSAAEGHGAWAAADPAVSTFGLAPGLAVVVLEGDLVVEGTTEHRIAAFPVRKAESLGAWFVEPWAYDLTADPPLQIVTPSIDDQERPTSVGEKYLAVQVDTPASGTAWLTTAAGIRESVDVGATGGTAAWQLEPGAGLVVITYVDGPVLSARAFRMAQL